MIDKITGSVAEALAGIAATSPEARVLICGSLYLAGAALALILDRRRERRCVIPWVRPHRAQGLFD